MPADLNCKVEKRTIDGAAVANGWTSERRAQQAALIRTWRPWDRSTGPRTEAGKAKASRNAAKIGPWKAERDNIRALNRYMRCLLRRQRELIRLLARSSAASEK